jgi:hypothetical protein
VSIFVISTSGVLPIYDKIGAGFGALDTGTSWIAIGKIAWKDPAKIAIVAGSGLDIKGWDMKFGLARALGAAQYRRCGS